MTRATAIILLLICTADPSDRPQGVWVLGPSGTQLNFRNGRLTWMISHQGSSITFDADYSITKDSMLYGIITKTTYPRGIDKEKLPAEDDTFSFRMRIDDNEMNVRNVRGKGFDQFRDIEGRYVKRQDVQPQSADRFKKK
jgi:hypothetical protein